MYTNTHPTKNQTLFEEFQLHGSVHRCNNFE